MNSRSLSLALILLFGLVGGVRAGEEGSKCGGDTQCANAAAGDQEAILTEIKCLAGRINGLITHVQTNVTPQLNDGVNQTVQGGLEPIQQMPATLREGGTNAERRPTVHQGVRDAAGSLTKGCEKGKEPLKKAKENFQCVGPELEKMKKQLEIAKAKIQQNFQEDSGNQQQYSAGMSALGAAEAAQEGTPAQLAAARAFGQKRLDRNNRSLENDRLAQDLAQNLEKLIGDFNKGVSEGGAVHQHQAKSQAVLQREGDSREGSDIYSCNGDRDALSGDVRRAETGLQDESGETFERVGSDVDGLRSRFERNRDLTGRAAQSSSDLLEGFKTRATKINEGVVEREQAVAAMP